MNNPYDPTQAQNIFQSHRLKSLKMKSPSEASPIPIGPQPRILQQVPQEARTAIREAARGSSPWPVLLYGPTGTGKTCAALCALDQAPTQPTRYYETLSELTRHIAQAMLGNYAPGDYPITENEYWTRYKNASLAVIDEIGSRSPSEHAYQVLYDALKHREAQPLILISNHTPEALAKIYDDRIASRITAGTPVLVTGPDRRRTNKPI